MNLLSAILMLAATPTGKAVENVTAGLVVPNWAAAVVAIATAATAVLVPLINIWAAFLSQRLAREQKDRDEKTAGKVETVAVRLETSKVETTTKLDSIAKFGEAAYHLANSAMEEQKRLLAVTARAKADITHDPVDEAAATAAEETYRNHKQKQDDINADAKEAKDAEKAKDSEKAKDAKS